jgi:hypothetical protein
LTDLCVDFLLFEIFLKKKTIKQLLYGAPSGTEDIFYLRKYWLL